MNGRPSTAFWLICAGAALLHGQPTPRASLLVLSKTDQVLSIVDPPTHKIIARIPSGPDPHEVAASTDGKLAFISNYGRGANNTLTVVDLIAQKSLRTVDLGALRGPHGLMFVGGRLWFTAEAAKAIGSYDPATNTVDWVLGTGQNRTHMIYVFDDAKRIITSNVSSASMTIIEKSGPATGDWQETVVGVGKGAEGFDVTPDLKEAWTANAQDGTISVMDVAAKKVTRTINANVQGANRLKFTPDGKLAFVSTLSGSDLTVFDTASYKELKRIKLGRAAGIQMQPDGLRAYVSCTPDNFVAIIDLKTLEVIDQFEAGMQPDGLAWAVQR